MSVGTIATIASWAESAAGWVGSRSPRERQLLAVAAACGAAVMALSLVAGARDEMARLRARVAAHERELGEVRRLAATLRRRPPRTTVDTSDDVPVLGRLETAAAESVGRERIAGMTPVAATAGGGADAVALRLAGASLAEVVRLLHSLTTGTPPLVVTRVELRKHPDDPSRFDAVVEVAR